MEASISRVVDSLAVNQDRSKREITYKNEEEGIRDIFHLVNSSDSEEMWVYLPEYEIWFQIGMEQIENGIRGDYKQIEQLIKENEYLTMYHFHPATVEDPEKLKKRFSEHHGKSYPKLEKGKEWFANIMQEIAYACDMMPSSEDLKTMFSQTVHHNVLHYLKGKIRFRICSYYGITESEMTDKGMEHFLDNFYRGFVEEYFAKYKEKIDSEIFKTKTRVDIDGIEKAKALAEVLSNEHIKIEFKTYEELGVVLKAA